MRSWLDTEKEWDELVRILEKKRIFGLDSEFVGVDFKAGDSCVNKAEIHVWSVGVLTDQLHPRGYHVAKGAVLSRRALQYDPIRKLLEDPAILKPAHNSNVDVHAFYNAGVDVQGIINTLGLARWMFPGRKTFNLDDLGTDYLGVGKTESFDDLFRRPNMITVIKEKTVKVCDCGVEGCRKRKGHVADDGTVITHNKTEITVQEEVDKQQGWYYEDQRIVVPAGYRVDGVIPVVDPTSPGHPLWERYEAYARRDATLAMSFYDFCMRQNKQTEIPWYDNTAK